MDSKERTQRAIERRAPDRVPVFFSTLPGAQRDLENSLSRLWEEYPQDIRIFSYPSTEEFSGKAGVPAVDRWGATWNSASNDVKGQVVEHPLADWANLSTFIWPEPLGGPEFGAAQTYLHGDQGRHYVLGDGDTLFQRMMYLRGIEELFVDLVTGTDEVTELRDRIRDYMIARIGHWHEIGVDGIYFRDDWGSQESLLINPELWRSFFKPVYAELFAAVHAGGTHVFFHSDGLIAAIIPDLVEIGVDVIHPQMQVLGARNLARQYGEQLSFMCDPDRQHVLPYGTPHDVEQHISQTLAALSRAQGGVVGWGEIGPDVPLENTEAMVRTFAEWHYR